MRIDLQKIKLSLRTNSRKSVNAWKQSDVFRFVDTAVSNRFRKKLTNHGFSILCSNCIGGTIYHRLGEEFLTPTINMYISQPDFIEFCLHLDHFLSEELVFIDSDEPCPVAKLAGSETEDIPSITIKFIHFKTEKDARATWNRRRTRINKDNLYIIMYKLDGVTVEQLKSLESVSCNNKIVLTSAPLPEISWSYYIKPIMSHQYPYNYMEKDLFGVRYFEKKWDFVSFLNQKGNDR